MGSWILHNSKIPRVILIYKDIFKSKVYRNYCIIFFSVSDALHFNADPDPDSRIRLRDGRIRVQFRIRIRIRPKIEQIPIFFFKSYKTQRFFFCNIELIINVYILSKISDFLFKKLYSNNFGWFVCEFITIYFLLPGSRSTFPEGDPDPDPAIWYGSNRIRIRNTDCFKARVLRLKKNIHVVQKAILRIWQAEKLWIRIC